MVASCAGRAGRDQVSPAGGLGAPHLVAAAASSGPRLASFVCDGRIQMAGRWPRVPTLLSPPPPPRPPPPLLLPHRLAPPTCFVDWPAGPFLPRSSAAKLGRYDTVGWHLSAVSLAILLLIKTAWMERLPGARLLGAARHLNQQPQTPVWLLMRGLVQRSATTATLCCSAGAAQWQPRGFDWRPGAAGPRAAAALLPPPRLAGGGGAAEHGAGCGGPG